MCDLDYVLPHFIEPPFVTHSAGQEIQGLLYDILIRSLHACCPTIPQLKPKLYDTQEIMMRAINNTNIIALPVSLSETMLIGNPGYFIPIIDSPGLSLISMKPIPNDISYQAMQSVWPLLLVIILLTGYAGFLLWIAELMGRTKRDRFPKSFLAEYFESCYCAFITATTVGYGDKVPKTMSGKMVVMIWIFFGIAVISAFTASMTTLLTSEQAEMSEKATLPLGAKIGVIHGSLSRQLVIKAGSYPVEAHNFSVLHQLLHEKNITGIALNYYFCSFLANHVPETFDIDNCRVGIISTGFVFKSLSPTGSQLRECIREYTLLRTQEQDYELQEMLMHRPSTRLRPTEIATSSIKRIVGSGTLAWLSYVLGALLLSVAIAELVRNSWRNKLIKCPKRESDSIADEVNKRGPEHSEV